MLEKKEQIKDPKIFRGGIAFLRIITNNYLGGSLMRPAEDLIFQTSSARPGRNFKLDWREGKAEDKDKNGAKEEEPAAVFILFSLVDFPVISFDLFFCLFEF